MGDSTMNHEVQVKFMEVDARLDALEANQPANGATKDETSTEEEDTYDPEEI